MEKQPESKKYNILIVLYYYEPYISGVSIYAKRLAEGLTLSGHNVTILTSRYDAKLPKSEIINGVKVIRRPVALKINKGVIMPTFWFDVIMHSKNNDFINPHLPMPDTGLSSLFIAKRKQIVTYQCDINLKNSIIGKIIVKLSFALMRTQLIRCKKIVALSDDYFSNSKMRKYMNKEIQIYPPIEIAKFKKTDFSNLKDSLKIKQNTKIIGFVGRIVYEKGIEYLLNAIPYLKKNISNFKIIIAGDYNNIAGGSIKEELDILINKYPSTIQFTGFLNNSDLVSFYSMIDVLVLPSIDPLEAFGMVQVEAMLCGTPVVASNLPGVREVINKTGYGLLCKPKDSKEIAKNIVEIINNHNKYLPDRNTIKKVFNPSETILDYESIMNEP